MTTTQVTATKTPGYNYRLAIFFTHHNGRKVAYRWSMWQIRAFRIPLAEAEIMQATGTADMLHCHPMRPCDTCKSAQ